MKSFTKTDQIKPVKKVKTKVILSLPQLKKKVQRAVNAYIRLRDKDLPCISCGATNTTRWEAGHFWKQGSHGILRYNLDNIHKQCHACNYHKGGNENEYRLRLVKKIGLERILILDEQAHETKHWQRDELEQILEEVKLLTALRSR